MNTVMLRQVELLPPVGWHHPMTAETQALGRCSECGTAYAIYEGAEGWRALGTDGSCQCGNRDFTVLSARD